MILVWNTFSWHFINVSPPPGFHPRGFRLSHGHHHDSFCVAWSCKLCHSFFIHPARALVKLANHKGFSTVNMQLEQKLISSGREKKCRNVLLHTRNTFLDGWSHLVSEKSVNYGQVWFHAWRDFPGSRSTENRIWKQFRFQVHPSGGFNLPSKTIFMACAWKLELNEVVKKSECTVSGNAAVACDTELGIYDRGTTPQKVFVICWIFCSMMRF